jgi:hypothetical protein
VADINDRLDRLQRREEFDRFGRPLRPAEDSVEPVVRRPAGVDDRLGEVLDAVAAVVRRHPGLSVMVAVADGRAGRPVVRVTERDGSVETGVVVAGPSAGPPAVSPAPAAQQAAVPTAQQAAGPTAQQAAMPAAARREPVPTRDPAFAQAGRETPVPTRDPAFAQAGRGTASTRESASAGPAPIGRHAAPHDDEPGVGWSGSSWHNALWSNERSNERSRTPEPQRDPEPDRLRLVPGERPVPGEPGAGPPPPGPTIPLPEDTSQVVSRLAQLLRENPTLASSWSREAPE